MKTIKTKRGIITHGNENTVLDLDYKLKRSGKRHFDLKHMNE